MTMQEQDSGRVKISAINELPVRVRHVSEKAVAAVSRDPRSARELRLGRVRGMLYALNDDETVLGLRRARAGEASASVREYGSVPELVAAHVMENMHPSSVDALLIGVVMEYLAKNGMDADEARRRTGLDRRPELAAAARAQITDEAREVLLEMCRGFASRLYNPVTPPYMVTLLARVRPDMQAKAAEALVVATKMTMRSDAKASWPSANGVDQVLRGFGEGRRTQPVSERVAERGSVDDLKKKNTSAPAPAKTTKKAEKYISDDPDLRYIPANDSKRDLLVNRKTGRVAEISEGSSTYVVSGDLSRPVHFLPDHVREYLDGDSPVRVTKYASAARASKALAKSRREGRIVVLSGFALPR